MKHKWLTDTTIRKLLELAERAQVPGFGHLKPTPGHAERLCRDLLAVQQERDKFEVANTEIRTRLDEAERLLREGDRDG